MSTYMFPCATCGRPIVAAHNTMAYRCRCAKPKPATDALVARSDANALDALKRALDR